MNIPSVSEFYDGKSVLLTGASGLLGGIILEELLRTCPGIKSIFVVIRPKKGVDPESRLEKVFEKKFFCELLRDQPEITKKVHLIEGDLLKPNIGISEEDIETIIEEVNIVFHVAASISFTKPLKDILKQNFLSTHFLAELCRKLKKCDAYVFTSSTYANCNRYDIETEEEVYRLPFKAEKFLKILLNDGSSEELEELRSQCYPPFPNTYPFSKNLSENYLVENTSDLPVAIVRPSVISPTHEKPIPGYSEDHSGISAICIAFGKGVIRVGNCDPDNQIDTVPCDVTAHAHIIAAARLHLGWWDLPVIFNCSSTHKLTLMQHSEICYKQAINHFAPLSFREPRHVRIVQNRFLFELLQFYEHFVPAYGFDLLLRLSGKKPKVVAIFRFIEKAFETTRYFATHNFSYKIEKFRKLMTHLNEEDKKLYVNPFEIKEYAVAHIHENARFYDWSLDKKTPAERKRAVKRNQFLSSLFKVIFLLTIGALIFLVVWLVTAV